jgi:hypothetical protein
MRNRVPLFCIVLLFVSLSLVGCSNTVDKDFTFNVLIDKLEKSKVTASLYYEGNTLTGLETKTFYWSDLKIANSKEEYQPTFSNIYPSSSVTHLQEQLQLADNPQKIYGQLYLYGNTKEYELFIFENSHTGKDVWRIFFSYENHVKEVVIPKDAGQAESRISSYQITDDAVYLFAHDEAESDIYMYKILLSNYQFTKTIIPLQKFSVKNVALPTDEVFIHDNVFILATSNYNIGLDDKEYNGNGVILIYNFANNQAETMYIDDKIAKLLPYNNGYIAICNEKDTYKAIVHYYNKDLKLLHKKYITVPVEEETVVAKTSQFYMHDGLIYGTLSQDGGKSEYLTVLNAETAEVEYFAKYDYNRANFIMLDAQFYLDEGGKFVHLKPF